MKRCSECGGPLPPERRHRYCRECLNRYKRVWHQNNRVSDLKARIRTLEARCRHLQAELDRRTGVRRVA